MTYSRKEFIEKVAPLVQKDTSGILHSLTIAQAILESGNGNSTLTREGNALFGIKPNASWRGKVWTGKTIEYYDGKTATNVVCGFRAYDSWEESILDHSKLLTSLSRYAKVVGEMDYKKVCKAIHAAGYATDPQYADKLINLIESNNLTQYDKPPVQDDKDLSSAVSKIIKSGIAINYDNWKRLDLIELKNVPALIVKLGGIDKLIKDGIINDKELWINGKYAKQHVRSLLIKVANKIKE